MSPLIHGLGWGKERASSRSKVLITCSNNKSAPKRWLQTQTSGGNYGNKVPPKVKNFLWRAVTGTLPTCVQVVIKHVDISVTYPVCNLQLETISHALISCPFAFDCWSQCATPVVFDPGGSFGNWLETIFKQAEADMICLIAMYSWAIWKARNKVVWKKKHSSVNDVLTSAQVALDHSNKAQDKILLSSICQESIGDGTESWTRPAENTIKINVDATLFDSDNKYGFRIVARNHLGHLVAAWASCHGGRYAAEVIEAMVIKEALSWVKTNNWQHVQIETDSLVSVQAMRSN
ncbi:uncharacterized protein LOC115717560 [Cannabis sativa]|uniref:uncharacterized protein LOC115717560 n=1 Tax=Cannabis sativa TaxID=3483 RepID=UPI0029CA95F2|nr:uncharacterized protein LOC115717560 [Cannabis sativa]